MPMAVIFPKVSLETDVGAIARWLKDDGASVEQGEALFEIDNDKAAVEVEAPASGIVIHLRAAGEEIQVGEVVGRILSVGEQPASASLMLDSEKTPAPAVAGIAAAIVAAPRPSRVVATPLARRIAEQRQIDLSAVQGSGPRGRIQKRDVLDPALFAAKAPSTHSVEQLNAVWLQKEGAATIVALHGFASDHNAWRSLLTAGKPQARILALDLPGHGKSTRAIPADLDAICELVEERLSQAGVERATLMGHSFGAAVATRLASRGFISVGSLLLMSPAGLGPEIRAEFVKGFVAARQPSSLMPWLRELVFDAGVISQAFVRSVETQRQDDGLSQALDRFAQRYFCDGTQTFSIRPDLERLGMPVRMIFGMEDRIIPFAHSHSLPYQVGLHAFQNCGHLPYLEQPERVLSLLDEMLKLARPER